MAVRNYDSNQVILTVDAIDVDGRPDGAFCSFSAPDDDFGHVEGNGGDHTRFRVNKRTGELTVNVMYGSDGHRLLSSLAERDLRTGRSPFPVRLADINGGFTVVAARCYIRKRPDIEIAPEPGALEWIIVMPEYSRTDGALTLL